MAQSTEADRGRENSEEQHLDMAIPGVLVTKSTELYSLHGCLS